MYLKKKTRVSSFCISKRKKTRKNVILKLHFPDVHSTPPCKHLPKNLPTEQLLITTFASNVTTASTPTPQASGRDSVRLPVETESSLMDTLGVADPNYGEHLSGDFKFSPHFSFV